MKFAEPCLGVWVDDIRKTVVAFCKDKSRQVSKEQKRNSVTQRWAIDIQKPGSKKFLLIIFGN